MTYGLPDLPIDRVNRKKGVITFLAVFAAVDWLLEIVLFASEHWSFSQMLATRNSFALAIWGGFCTYGAVYFYRRHSRLVIDKDGVQVTEDGKTRRYPWEDIARARKAVVDRNGDKAVQIVRKGQIITDDHSDLIWAEFGLSLDELIALIHAGQAKWGAKEGSV